LVGHPATVRWEAALAPADIGHCHWRSVSLKRQRPQGSPADCKEDEPAIRRPVRGHFVLGRFQKPFLVAAINALEPEIVGAAAT
jgi:hypothetical protein